MSERHPLPLWAAAVASIALLGACTGTDATQATADPTPPPSDQPIDLMQLPEDTVLEPGSYSVGLLYDDGPARAVVDVPDGFVGGGPVIGSHDGDVAFWGRATQVDTDPCLGGRHVRAGTTVHDLASALAAQRHMRTSRPVPVTVGGFHGVYLASTAPADIRRCRGGSVTIYTAGGTWLQSDVPNTTFHAWILNVRGIRVVGGARVYPHAAHEADLVHLVESAEFPVADLS